MATIGQELGNTRREKGLSVGEVAHETRIDTRTLSRIEADDFSMFPNLASAKSFIRNYSEYLEVDLSDFLESLSTSDTIRFSDNAVMGEMKDTIKKDRLFCRGRQPLFSRRRFGKPGGAPVFLNFILAVLIAALVIFYFLGYNASTIDEANSGTTNGLKRAKPLGHEEGSAAVPESGGGLRGEEIAPSFEPVTSGDAEKRQDGDGDGDGELPALKRPQVEPRAELRPEGADPAAIPKPRAELRPEGTDPAAIPKPRPKSGPVVETRSRGTGN